MPINKHIITFDLDGTLLNSNKEISQTDFESLQKLGQRNAIRIAATGRNYFSVKQVLNPNFPVDYIVFSSGAGIMDWKTKKIKYKSDIDKSDIEEIIKIISPHKLNFTIHLPIPNNHNMLLFNNHSEAKDLENYTAFYKDFVQTLNPQKLPQKATQVIVLLNRHVHLFIELKKQLTNLKVILTTSPVNHKSMWMEVFNKNVSKANGVKWILNHLKIKHTKVFAIGNDFNDLDLLNYADISYVTANAPKELQQNFNISKSNDQSALTHALKKSGIL